MLYAMDGGRGNGRLLVGLCDAQVVRGETLIHTRNVDAWLQVRVVNRKTLYDFHNYKLSINVLVVRNDFSATVSQKL